MSLPLPFPRPKKNLRRKTIPHCLHLSCDIRCAAVILKAPDKKSIDKHSRTRGRASVAATTAVPPPES
jgi:hypothetical protein